MYLGYSAMYIVVILPPPLLWEFISRWRQ